MTYKYAVWCDFGFDIGLLSAWEDYYDAIRECDSLNRYDKQYLYYITLEGVRIYG